MTFGTPRGTGWIEVICGSMFSGKTEELIRRLRRSQIARQKVAIFKPRIDDRYQAGHIVSHSRLSIPSQTVELPVEIVEHITYPLGIHDLSSEVAKIKAAKPDLLFPVCRPGDSLCIYLN